MDANQKKNEEVPVREDFHKTIQCPCCDMFFGLYIYSPADPSLDQKIGIVPPDAIEAAHKALTTRWREQGGLVREDGKVLVDPKSTN